jgi:hypothetical protein
MTPAALKKAMPRSLEHAYELSIAYALVVHHRKVPEIASMMGVKTARLYKWLSKLSMPAIAILAFEHACGGCHFVTNYLASSDNRLVIEIPRGRKASASEIAGLQTSFGKCITLLSEFFDGKGAAEETSEGIRTTMRQLAWHQVNVDKQIEPELALFASEDE